MTKKFPPFSGPSRDPVDSWGVKVGYPNKATYVAPRKLQKPTLRPTINLWAVLSDLSDRTLVPETVSQLAVHYWHYLICLDIYIIYHIHIHIQYTNDSMGVFLHARILLSRGVWKNLPIFWCRPFFSVKFSILENPHGATMSIFYEQVARSLEGFLRGPFFEKKMGSSMWRTWNPKANHL